VVVVYKVDRLSRSLKDFVNLFTFFEKYQVSFISITQQIDTSSSMGKLTLNMLLSFAQFEREITSERLKDKIKAAKKKGMWTGGFIPMGYDSKDKRLIRNKDAKIIEEIFEKIASGLAIQEVVSYFNNDNILTNTGVKFCKNKIYQILNNRIYIGEILHEGKSYKGRHKSIIPKSLWEAAHQQLKSKKLINSKRASKYPALLKGLVFCKYCNCAMTPNYTKKKKAIFRYYLCMNIVRYGSNACHLKRINAIELEEIIEKEILRVLRDPRISVNFLNKEKVIGNRIEDLWQNLPADQKQIVAKDVVQDIIVDHFSFKIALHDQPTFYHQRIIKDVIYSDDKTALEIKQNAFNYKVKKLIKKALQLKKYQKKGLSISKIAAIEKKSKSHTARIVYMNHLFPEIRDRILSPDFAYKLKVKDFEWGFPKSKEAQLVWFNSLLR
jgi:hypothetical protein